MELQVGVKALLKNREGKYLLVRRSAEKYKNFVGSWDIVGGRIEPGTPLIENLKREIKEEIGLEVRDKPKLIAAQDILRVPGRHVVRLTYVAAIDGEPRLSDESVEYRWHTVEELKSNDDIDVYFKELLDKNVLG